MGSAVLVDQVVRENAVKPKKELEKQLKQVPMADLKVGIMFDISLNYEAGGAQYLQCVKFTCKKNSKDEIVVAYANYGKMWTEASNYSMDKAFWQSNEQKVKNFLEYGAYCGLIDRLKDGGSCL